MDSGIDGSHGDFADRLGKGYSVYGADDPYDDCVGHGTHVAGTAAGAPKVASPPRPPFTRHGDGLRRLFRSGRETDGMGMGTPPCEEARTNRAGGASSSTPLELIGDRSVDQGRHSVRGCGG